MSDRPVTPPDLGARKELRQPGLVVYLCGFGVSALVLYIAHLLAQTDFNVMGWYANGIIPAGALLVGMACGLGYPLASYYLNVKLNRAFVVGMLATAFFDYWVAEYMAYSRLLEQHHISTETLPFFTYLKTICESMRFSHNGGTPGGELGWGGYFFKALEVVGFCGGMMIPSAALFKKPYCGGCQAYLKPIRTAFVNSDATRDELFKLPRKERAAALGAVTNTLGQHAQHIAQQVGGQPLDGTLAFFEGLQPSRIKSSTGAISAELRKCPRCDAHHVAVTLTHVTLDKKVASRVLHNIDNTLAPAA